MPSIPAIGTAADLDGSPSIFAVQRQFGGLTGMADGLPAGRQLGQRRLPEIAGAIASTTADRRITR